MTLFAHKVIYWTGNAQSAHKRSANIWFRAMFLIMTLWLVVNWVSFAWADSPFVDLVDKDDSIKLVSLDECLQIARYNSVEIETARANLRIAELKQDDAKANAWPRVAASVDYVVDDEQGVSSESDQFRAYLSVTQKLFNSGENFDMMREAMINLVTTKLMAEQTKRTLSFSVAERYFALLLAKKRLKLESSLLEQSLRDLKETETKYHDGLAAEIDVIQNKANLGSAKLNLGAKQNALEHARMALAIAVGLPAATPLRAVDVDFPEFYTVDWNRCQELAMQNNTELEIQREALEEMGRYHKLAKRAGWGTVSLSAFVGQHAYDPYDEDANLGLTLTISKNIFDGGITRRRVKRSEIEIKKNEAVIKDFKQRFLSSLRLLFNKLNGSKEELLNAKNQCELSSRLSKLSRRSYELGAISFKDMLDSQDMAKKAEIDYASAIAQYQLTEFNLKVKMGAYRIDKTSDNGEKSMRELETQKLPGATLDDKEEVN